MHVADEITSTNFVFLVNSMKTCSLKLTVLYITAGLFAQTSLINLGQCSSWKKLGFHGKAEGKIETALLMVRIILFVLRLVRSAVAGDDRNSIWLL